MVAARSGHFQKKCRTLSYTIPGPVERSAVERSLDASIRDGTAYAVMVGLGETYVGACALFLGASSARVGLLYAIPFFLGACTQVLSLNVIDRVRRRKPVFVAGSAVQMLAWIPMIASLFAPRPAGFWLLFSGFLLYFASIHFTVPAWMSVMGDLVPPAGRGRYFGRRNALALFMQGLAVTLGGAGLWIYERSGHEALGYAVVFGGAMLARGVSVFHLARMAEPPYASRDEDRFTLWQFLRRLPESNFARFALFVACLNASANFVGAIFIPYWRRDLGYSYWELMAVMIALLVVQVPSMIFWGRVADRYGNKKVLVAASFGIALLPLLWIASTHVVFACFMQMWSGFWWSGFNQSVGNFLFDAVSPPKRARCTAYMNLLANAGVLVGGLAGAWAIRVMPREIGPVTLPYAFWGLLVVSFLLRVAVTVLFLPRFREVRDVPQVGVTEMLFHATREATESAVNLMTGWVRREPDRST